VVVVVVRWRWLWRRRRWWRDGDSDGGELVEKEEVKEEEEVVR